MVENTPSVGIVIPTRNSSRTLSACLHSIRDQTFPCELVVVDNHSTDETKEIASRFADQVLSAGPERSAQRNIGAASIKVDILGFIDSDMVLSPNVVTDAVKLIAEGAGAVIVPERTVGLGYWAKVRAYERTFYLADEKTEAARFFDAVLFRKLGGFDEAITGPEDLDLTIRARKSARIARSSATIDHFECYSGYLDACRKKGYYVSGVIAFGRKHGRSRFLSFVDRGFLHSPWKLLKSPLLGVSVLLLKVGEAGAMLEHLTRQQGCRGQNSHRR